jgi:phenylalanyl-tRNA synthetase beta chain
VLSGLAEAGSTPKRRWVSVRPSRASWLVGYEVTRSDAETVFGRLGFAFQSAESDGVDVEVPGYRVDIEREVDLIEEVVRLQGYERVGSALPRSSHSGGLPSEYHFVRTVREALVRLGLREVRPLPFSSVEDLRLTGDRDAIAIANPLRAEEGFLRTRLTPGLLHAVSRNQALGVRQIALFEVGHVFRLGEPTSERRKVALALSGPRTEGWWTEDMDFDALDARGVVEALMKELGVETWSVGGPLDSPFNPARSGSVLVAGNRAGVLGEIHPRVAQSLDIDGRVAVAELELNSLAAAADRSFVFRDVPRFPPVRRDLAFVVPESVAAVELRDAIVLAGGSLLDRAVLFDLFHGDSLPEGTKSLAFSLDFRAPDRTLTDEEAEDAVRSIVSRVESDLGGRLRTA